MPTREDVDRVAGCSERELSEFTEGYRLGVRAAYQTGFEDGYRKAHEEMAAQWAEVAAKVRGEARFIGLLERRWGGRREDFGKPRPGDFTGI